jgi:polysaccharide export outer membrane protein
VIEAIGAAGGLTALASGNSAILTRRVDGQLKRFKVPVESISEGEAEDFTLQSGDIVFVPERIF